MVKLTHLHDTASCPSFSSLPQAVQQMITEVLNILDETYGVDRDMFKDLGGYAVILESLGDIESLNDSLNVNLETATFEYIDVVSGYLGCLLILGTDYHLYIILPRSIAPPHVLGQIDPCCGVGGIEIFSV
jgi:hypothetical protein